MFAHNGPYGAWLRGRGLSKWLIRGRAGGEVTMSTIVFNALSMTVKVIRFIELVSLLRSFVDSKENK